MKNPDRPRMPDDVEERLRDVEEASAMCYGEAEHLAARLHDVAKRVGDDATTSPGPTEAVPDAWPEDENTLQYKIDNLRRKSLRPSQLADDIAEALARPAPPKEPKK